MPSYERMMDKLSNQDARKGLENALIISRIEASQIEDALKKNGFKIVERNPDFVVCYGGDGTVLFSERKFPQVPKLVVKMKNTCRKCDYTLYDFENILFKIREGKFKIRKKMKLETEFENERLVGLNEIQIRAKLPIHAIRFSVFVDGKEFGNLIGDGIVVATPFGSTGYYRSTGGRKFNKGIGISFNNLHNKKIESFVVPESTLIRVKVNRGPTWVLADNYEKFLVLKDNVISTIRKSKGVANFIYVPLTH